MSTAERIDRRQTRDATEQRILDGTTRLLDAGASLAGLSVNRIVEESGVSRATFYLHFTDKRGLVNRLAERELTAFEALTASFLADPDAGREELAEVAREMIALWRAHAGVLSSLIELAEYDAESREAWQAVVGAVAAQIKTAMLERRSDLTDDEASDISQVIAWAGERSLHQMLGRDSTDQRAEAIASAMTEVIWRVVDA